MDDRGWWVGGLVVDGSCVTPAFYSKNPAIYMHIIYEIMNIHYIRY